MKLKIKRILSVLLVFCMMIGVMQMNVFAAEVAAPSATVEEPEYGKKPSFEVSAGGSGYKVEVVKWFDKTNNKTMTATDTFGEGKYEVYVKFSVEEGNSFASPFSCTINGKAASVDHNYAFKAFDMKVEFDVTETNSLQDIGSANATVTVPEYGNVPNMSATAGDSTYTVEIYKWSNELGHSITASDTFDYGYNTVYVKFIANDGYKFADDAKYYINGTELTGSQIISTDLSVTETCRSFEVEKPAGSVTSIAVTPATTEVEVGKTQQFTAEITGTGVYETNVYWEVIGANSYDTLIDNYGLLTVAADETADSFTVKASISGDSSKYATATVTVKVPTTIITEISSTLEQIPEVGKTVLHTCTNTSIPENALAGAGVIVMVSDSDSNSPSDWTIVSDSDAKYEAGKYYLVYIPSTPEFGYAFGESVVKKINGYTHDTRFDEFFNNNEEKQFTLHVWGPLEAAEPETPATTAVTVVKEWNAPEGTVLPESVRVALYANGVQILENVLSERNDWTWTEEGLPVATEDGTPIVYTVDEVEVPEGYEKTIGEALETDTGIEIAITNTLIEEEPEVPETVDVAGTKTWVGDEEAERPESIIVNLLANGEVIDEAEVTARTQWTFYFGELPKYDEAGAEIEYSVEEEEVEGYTVTYDGYNITNTLKEEPEDPEKPVYGIVVNNGKSYAGAGVEVSAAEEGTKITLKADAASEGKEFDKWVVNNGTITLADATKAETTFDMPAERVEVTATYKDKVVTPPADDDNSDDTDKPSDDNKDDESKPSDTNKPTTDTESPKTGDTSNIFMWFAVLFVSGFALVGFVLFGRKRRA